MNEIELLRENLKKQENLVNELLIILENYIIASSNEKLFLEKSSISIKNQLAIINESAKELINNIGTGEKKIVREYKRIETTGGPVFIKKGDKERYQKELKIASFKIKENYEKPQIIKKPSSFVTFSSRLFRGLSKSLSKPLGFLDKEIKEADMAYILTAYISLILFLTLLILIVSLIIAVIISINKTPIILIRNLLISLIIPFIVFIILLIYPKLQASGNSKKLETEMPFALSHMAAIASSRIEPSKIFSIMANSQEYKLFAQQMRKISNQMHLYGYDLVTSLKNVAHTCGNRKLSEVLNGLATTIISGGDLIIYLKEKAKDLLLDYKLSREKYSTTIGMYSDIYTALLIAAPLILMLVISIMSTIGASFANLSLGFLANIGIIIIAALNILFLLFLHLTQPEV